MENTLDLNNLVVTDTETKNKKHPLCRGVGYETLNGPDHYCDYETTINCDDCKYGGYTNQPDKRLGKNPEAKCNQPKM